MGHYWRLIVIIVANFSMPLMFLRVPGLILVYVHLVRLRYEAHLPVLCAMELEWLHHVYLTDWFEQHWLEEEALLNELIC